MTGLRKARRGIRELGTASVGASLFPVVGTLTGAGAALGALDSVRGKKRKGRL